MDCYNYILNTIFIVLYTGVIVGAIIHYAIGTEAHKEVTLTTTYPQYTNHCDILGQDINNTLTVGEVITLITLRDNFSCTVKGKQFRTKEGNFIQQTVSLVIQLMLMCLVVFDSCVIVCTFHAVQYA